MAEPIEKPAVGPAKGVRNDAEISIGQFLQGIGRKFFGVEGPGQGPLAAFRGIEDNAPAGLLDEVKKIIIRLQQRTAENSQANSICRWFAVSQIGYIPQRAANFGRRLGKLPGRKPVPACKQCTPRAIVAPA